MAQNIEIANAQYNDVPSIEVPLQGGGTASFVDTTDADAIASEIDMGKTAYVNGVKLTGTRSGGGGGGYTETVLYTSSSGAASGTLQLLGKISDYDIIKFTVSRLDINNDHSWSNAYFSASELPNLTSANNSDFYIAIYSFDNDYVRASYVSDTSIRIDGRRNSRIMRIIGIKFG